MDLKNKKILITGACGFIGSHLTEKLVSSGYNVKAFVQYNSFNSWGWLDHIDKKIKDNIEVFSGDIRDTHGVASAIKGCDVVFHLAALIGIPYSFHSPSTYIDTNVNGTLNIIQAAQNTGIEKIVHTSSSEVYGTALSIPISEEHRLQAQSPYAASKIGADQIAMSFHLSFGTPVAIVRPFNTYGPRQSARAVIPTVILQIAAGKTKLKLGSIHPTRDFSYISDTVNGMLAVAESDNTVGEVVNLGSNFEISVGNTANLIATIMKKNIQIETDIQRVRPNHSEVERLFSDNSKAQKLTGWKPEFAGVEGFQKGLERTIAWFSDIENLSSYKVNRYNI